MEFFFRKLIPMIFIFSIFQEIENKVEEKKTFNDLQDEIDNLVGNQLYLISDYVFDPKVDKPTGIIIKKPLEIDINGFHIDGLNQSKIFQIYNTEVFIRAGVFINGFSEDFGGAINLINSTLHVIISDFSYNSANIKGGGIYLNNSFLNITDCTFRHNYVKSLYLTGGGIAAENSKIRINISHLNDNYADEGAAIYSIKSTVDIYNSLIYNYANWYGGAIVSDSHLFINNSRIFNNRAGYKGGAIHTTYSYSTDNCFLDINYSSLVNNSAEYGGLISSSNIKYIHINYSEFNDNRASFGAVISRMSSNDIQITNSSGSNNIAIKGSILYSVAGGNNSFIRCSFTNNKADVGGLIYTISGRYLNKVNNFSSTFSSCNLADNYGKKGLVYSIYDDLIFNSSSITYLNKSYDIPVIYKIVGGRVILNSVWFGEINPDLNKLIIYEYDNITNNNKLKDNNNLRSDGCSSTVIQIDDNHWAFTFRRDSSKLVYVNIEYQKDGILQYKTDQTFFFHTILNKDGWIIGNGGVDSPHSCEKLEAYSKIMIKKKKFINEFIENAFQIKSMQTLGHYFIKSPNGTYTLVSHNKSLKTVIIETGKLKSGEYIICPNNYEFYQKGKILDLNIKENYTYISRYLAAIDEYSSERTNEFTYNYMEKGKSKYIDIFISNDDGSLSNKPNTSSYFNDIFINEKYILGERVPIIMDGMYLDRYIIQNKNSNLKISILLFILFLIL